MKATRGKGRNTILLAQEIAAAVLQLPMLNRPNALNVVGFKPKEWWECDVLSLVNLVEIGDVLSEIEVKVSRGDFAEDAKKVNKEGQNKHDLIAEAFRSNPRYTPVPNYVYFATPRNMLAESELPEWAGLIEVDEETLEATIAVSPPILHHANFATTRQAMLEFSYRQYHKLLRADQLRDWKETESKPSRTS